MNKSFQGKHILITGASAGIGRALSQALAERGAHLTLTARRLERLEALAMELQAPAQTILPAQCDVTQDGSLEEVVSQAHEQVGPIDIAIANAGFAISGRVEDLSLEEYRRQFETNIFGVLRTFQATIEDLKQTKGTFVIVGSVTGYIALPGNSAYSMSKSALNAFAQALYHECKPQGVNVVLINPGFVKSEIRMVNNQGTFNPEHPDYIPQWISMPADVAAQKMLKAIARKKREAIITGHGQAVAFLCRHFPRFTNFLISSLGINSKNRGAPH